MSPPSAPKYKVKLSSGRVLGPLDHARIALFIKKGQIIGVETVRLHPDGSWVDINSVPSLAELLLQNAQQLLPDPQPPKFPGTSLGSSEEVDQAQIPTVALKKPGHKEPNEESVDEILSRTKTKTRRGPTDPTIPPLFSHEVTEGKPVKRSPPRNEVPQKEPEIDNDKTVVDTGRGSEPESDAPPVDPDATVVHLPAKIGTREIADPNGGTNATSVTQNVSESQILANVSNQRTVMMTNPLGKEDWNLADAVRDPRKLPTVVGNSARDLVKKIVGGLATLSILFIIYTLINLNGNNSSPLDAKWVPVRAKMPVFDAGTKDPQKSTKLYFDAMRYYFLDTVPGYKKAAELLTEAAQYDSSNTKALALLASTYLNLIDSSNKDENYFSVISKLIELSRAKDTNLAETVIADVEFYITLNKVEAAENRIVDFTKRQSKFGRELFYYLALAFYYRGDAQSAIRYISEYSEAQAFSPKVFFLRGMIAEKLGDNTAALQEYQKAIKLSATHAKSRLAIVNILFAQDQLQNGALQLEYLTQHPTLLAPKDLARAYFLHAKLSMLSQSLSVATADMRRAVKLEPENHEYLLELYSLLAKSDPKNTEDTKLNARMYYFLGEGEKFLKVGKYQEALAQFLQARQAEDRSPLPLVKIGDMFLRMNDLGSAKSNYKMAADRAPDNINVWSKYMDVLIQSYEWQDAMAAMDKFRKLPVPQSAIDKAAADMYAKQGAYNEAQMLYQKAMARDVIDPSVYLAYAKVLVDTKNYKEAPFFFALALRFDPLNIDAWVGTARCIAETESIDYAVSMLQDELKKGTLGKAELLSAIAELYIQKGSWGPAEDYVNQAIAANPDYPNPYKLKAKIFLNRENTEKGALEKALDAYNSYSNRNASDPSGYLERYRIFVKKGDFEKADDELRKIYAIYPKYPNLHFYKGALYSIMGNSQKSKDEFEIELKNNPGSVPALVALGKEYLKIPDPNHAITILTKAMQLAPRAAEPRIELAWANYMAKNYDGAAALLNSALRIDPGNPILYKRLGLVLRDKGDSPGAAKAFQKYLEMEPDASDRAEFENYR